MSLEIVEPETDVSHMNVLLYGSPKQGKSSAAASAPDPILYVNCDLPNALSFARRHNDGKQVDEVRATGLQTLIDVTTELQANPEKYRTVVVDPVGELYRILLEDLSGRVLSPKIQHYGDTGTHLERFIRGLCSLPIHVVVVAHEQAIKDEAVGGFEKLPQTGTQNPKLGERIMGMVDIVGYCGIVPGEGDDPDRYVAALRSGNGRRGGDRFGVLGEARELNLSEWADVIAGQSDV